MRWLKLSFTAILLTTSLSCDFLESFVEDRTSVVIESGQPPTITIRGKGILDHIVIRGPEDKCNGDYSWPPNETYPWFPLDPLEAYWEIAPRSDFDMQHLVELGPIEYGKVPEGFRQATPTSRRPPPLCDGGPYIVEVFVRNKGSAGQIFRVQDGKIEVQPVKD